MAAARRTRGYANLNTAIFDRAGVHWFTGQSGIYGRLDPRTGDMKVFDAPKGRGPYGIHATPDGNRLLRVARGFVRGHASMRTDSTTVLEPPTPRQGARRVWSDSKGNIWVAEWNSGNRQRYEPKANKWKAWKAPGERPQVYAVYVDETDKVWVSEWASQTMLRFDPATEKFETFKSSTRLRERAPDPRPQGRGVDAGVGRRQDRRLSLQVILGFRPDFSRSRRGNAAGRHPVNLHARKRK